MLACDEVSDRPPQSLIHGHDRRALHQMLDRRHRFRVAGMKIEIAVPDREGGTAAGAHEAARPSEDIVGTACGSPNGIGCVTNSALENSKNLGNLIWHLSASPKA